ncbi:hypothetical protein RJ55_03509 [Drechmeria coniospora]|nr:hypothetical protein RJ55_03509 [Drechmeria coniospora]
MHRLARHGRPSTRKTAISPLSLPSRLLPSRRGRFSTDAASHDGNRTQVYVSRSRDPLLNLSVEHHLLQVTPPQSTVLLLYVNAPCVVVGRNQNPWLEVNLPRLARIAERPAGTSWTDGPVQLVRRRSGGGTVFHDAGNVNFSVICPPAAFDRDKHAEMVVRALRSLGRPATRVNERHDIVIDLDSAQVPASTFKVSGSAYKLTRLRSLHHGTCLLRSPNLSSISAMLRSPAEPFIKARGVESVRSPVCNLGLDNEPFRHALLDEFVKMHGHVDLRAEFDDDALAVDKIRAGYDELQSRSWTYGQTPRFTFDTHPSESPRRRPLPPFDLKIHFDARHGVLEDFSIEGAEVDTASLAQLSLHDVGDWVHQLAQAGLGDGDAARVGTWMNEVLGTAFTKPDA